MSKSEKSEKKNDKKNGALPIIIGVFLVLGAVTAGGLFAASDKIINSDSASDIAPASGKTDESAATDDALESEDEKVQAQENAAEKAPETEASSPDGVAEDAETPAPAAPDQELTKLTTPRILGNPESPVKITEHSSFTCGACAHYHKDNFKRIKADYIDTGKAYLVYDDFPRNIVDLEVGMVARCLPETSYFNFVQLLFETQEKWASDTEYKKFLKQNAMLAGLGEDKIEECLKNEALQKALADHRETAMNKFGVKGTPTLIINDKVVVGGTSPYDQIKTALDEAYAQSKK